MRHDPSSTRGPARAGLLTRAVLVVLGLALIALAAVAGINVVGSRMSANAAEALTSNLRAASAKDADLNGLLALQKQTDSQFATVLGMKGVLLPSVREPAQRNASTSLRLTQLFEKQLHGSQSSSTSQSTASPSPTSSSSSTSSQSLTDEQRQEIEKMLKSNSSTGSSSSPTPTTSSSSGGSVRPW